jgi:environmental stress-induced protein Ves
MIRHLTQADYRAMPWANGKGVTVEMLRIDGPGGLLLRLSRASVVEDGAFSIFPGIERNLTVITGPGFDLVGSGPGGAGLALRCPPLVPVAFAGDVPVAAAGVSAPSDDFNVMTARALPRPEVRVLAAGGQVDLPDWGAVYALAAAQVGPDRLAPGDLVLADGRLDIAGPVIVVALRGIPRP